MPQNKKTTKKTESVYRDIIKGAWHTFIKSKQLWFLGLFAALLGNAGEYQLLFTSLGGVSGGRSLLFTNSSLAVGQATTGSIVSSLTTDPFSTFVLLLLGLLFVALTVFFIWLTIVSVTGLIKSAALSATNNKPFSLGEAVESGHAYFGEVLVIYVFSRIITWLLLTLLFLFGALAAFDAVIGLPLFIVGFLLIVPSALSVAFIARYTVLQVVLKGGTVIESFEYAVAFFRKHWIITIELAALLFVINSFAGIVLAFIVGQLVVPLLIGSAALWSFSSGYWAASVSVLAIIIFVASLFTIGAALGSFQWTAWTHLFVRLQKKRTTSKIVRLLSNVVPHRHLSRRSRS